jgi:hypothetical protein
MKNPLFLARCVIALLVFVPLALPAPADKKSDCGKPPQLLREPGLSKEDSERIRSKSLTGRVAVVIDEDGGVTVERVITANPAGGAQILHDTVVHARFKPRPGCGPLRAVFVFMLTSDR